MNTDTSAAAHEAIAPHAAAMRLKVLTHIREVDGATCDEIEIALGMKHQTASARLTELVKSGHAYKTICRRPTRSGCSARVIAAVTQ